MKYPDDVEKVLRRRFRTGHRDWLMACSLPQRQGEVGWAQEVVLGIPTENQALKQIEDLRAWITTWQRWSGAGSIVWTERRWRMLGIQRVPEKLVLANPTELAQWAGEDERWERALYRYTSLVGRWPQLAQKLPRYFDQLADYSELDCRRLVAMLDWIEQHPASNLYPRQLPIPGLDSKWLEQRKGLLADLVEVLLDEPAVEGDLFQRCGLRAPPQLVRLRVLDNGLRQCLGGLGDITAPCEQLAGLDLSVASVFIVENLQTGLAFEDIPGAVVIMHLGYGVDVLGRLPWIARASCVYWGDLDTHGFAILNRARSYLPQLKSVLMDEVTLRLHQDLWVEESVQHAADELPLLTEAEQAVYRGLKRNTWGQQVRLEQERIDWELAWKELQIAAK